MTVRCEKIGPHTLYLGDCREVLPTLSGVDAVVTDPPYGVGFDYASHDDSRSRYEDDLKTWLKVIPYHATAITPGIANVCLYPQPRWVLAWMKTNSMGANRLSGPGKVSRNLWEPILWYGNYPPNPPSRDLIYAAISPEDNGFGHPCPKPISLMSQLVAMATGDDQSVLDPFMGSGTTGVACDRLGRKFIGIEIDPKYFDIACRRIEAEVRQGKLFEQEGATTDAT